MSVISNQRAFLIELQKNWHTEMPHWHTEMPHWQNLETLFQFGSFGDSGKIDQKIIDEHDEHIKKLLLISSIRKRRILINDHIHLFI